MKRLLAGLGGGALALLLVGCAVAPAGDPIDGLPPADLPRYTPGETLIYENRRSEQVVSSRDGRTLWQDQRGERLTRADNFVLPILSRQGSAGVYVHRLLKGDPDQLWPLGRGVEVSFEMLYVRPDLREFTQYWSCQDLGGRRISQHQRNYDTYLVRCIRSYENSSYQRVRSEQLDFYYEPRLQLLVRWDSIDLRNRRPPWVMKLWAYLRPADATVAQIDAIRSALKERPPTAP